MASFLTNVVAVVVVVVVVMIIVSSTLAQYCSGGRVLLKNCGNDCLVNDCFGNDCFGNDGPIYSQTAAKAQDFI